jgi:hypothetical protein
VNEGTTQCTPEAAEAAKQEIASTSGPFPHQRCGIIDAHHCYHIGLKKRRSSGISNSSGIFEGIRSIIHYE